MGIIRTFISHSNDDKPRGHDILRRVAPYGARPWIDDQDLRGQAGGSLRELIRSGIADPSCRSLSIFLSAASVKSQWVLDEVGAALALIPDGWRIIPVALDPVTDLALPPILENALRKRGNGFDTIYLDPMRAAFCGRLRCCGAACGWRCGRRGRRPPPRAPRSALATEPARPVARVARGGSATAVSGRERRFLADRRGVG